MSEKKILRAVANGIYCETADTLRVPYFLIRANVELVMHIYPLGLIFLKHFLNGRGENLRIPTEGVIENDIGVKTNVRDKLCLYIDHGLRFDISNDQTLYADSTYQMALGSVNFQWKIADTYYGSLHGIHKNVYIIDLWFVNRYRWHEKAARLSQCMHRAYADSSGQEFIMYGRRAFYELTISHDGIEKKLAYLEENTSFLRELRLKNQPAEHTATDVIIRYPESRKYFTIY
ncbi:hypothetical protein [Dyadobacter sp. CY343]|uniref:hypothetical protein n=1 Tax=Dyadobacter sp. CY343 TaxID=2907299 RepID=UPI001F217223|nr:hypothetical protein [Dyadobacter sp. CY343]MCE7059234.1 hypothetical protein [Dyadobacter sp. CY343]